MAAKRKRRSTDPATIAATIADRDTSIQSCFRTTKGNAQPIKKVTVKTPPNPRFKPPTGVKCAANGIARVDSGNAISKLLLRHSSSSSSTTSCTDSVEEVELLPEERGLQNQPESNWRDNAGIGTQSDSVFLGYPPEKKPRTAWTPTRPPLAVESFGVTSTLLCSTGECVGSLEECDRRANHIENQFLTASDVMRTRQEISPGSSFSQFGNIGYDEIAEMESREVEAARMLALKVTPDNSKPAHPGQNLDHQRSKLKIVRKPAGHNVRRSQTLGPHFHALQKADHENVGGEPLLGDTENVSLEVSRSEHYPHKESVDQTSVLLKDAPASVTDTVNVPGDEEWPFISDSLLSESQSTSPILISKDAVPGSLTSSLSVRPPQFLTSSPGEAHVGNICPPSRELAAETKPGDLSDQTLSLSHKMYGLSEDIVTAYSRCGITSLYPWQAECLQLDGVLAGSRNLLYSAPTSGGKSLVADIVMLQKVMSTRRKAIMIVPFVALASERTKVMQTVFSSERLKIVGYYSDVGSTSFDNVDIGYCTIEKANSLINRLIEERKLETLGIVVVDEVHMAGDPQRGYLLELLLTKLLFILAGDLQIVGMSATLPNINIFKDWLSAHLYITAFRPVPLTEYIKFEGNLYDSKGQLLQNLGKANSKDPDFVVPLVRHTLLESASVLIFCPGSKRYCENTAKLLALQLPACNDPAILTQRRGVVRELERTPGGLDLDLATFVTAGVAFHHSGLMTEEKEIIEDAYRSGIVKVIACTSTLAMGVNLPARRVIFRDLKKYKKELLTPREYQQMRGRAGRKGLDAHGESIIMCSDKTEFEAARNLISSELHPVTSCLLTDRKGMKRAVLEVVVAGVANSLEDLKTYLKSTLLHAELGHFDSGTVKCLLNAVAFLKEHDFVEQSLDGRLAATRLGCAAVYSSLSPEEALVVYGELRRASSRFSLSEDLHTVYLVTPVYMEEKYVSWARYAQLYAELVGDENRKNVADLIGISEAALYRAHRRQGWEPEHMPESRAVHKRFYIAMILSDLVQEKPFDAILHKYGGISRGDLQSLQSQSGSFAGMVKIFCQQLGWENLVAVVDKFQDRLQFGVSADLVELMQVPEIGGVRARLLYAEGYKDITALACASPEAICEALRKGSPFNPADKDRDAQRRLLFRAAHLISQGALKVVQAQLKEAAIEAQRKRSLLARVRELRTPPSTSPQSEGSTSSKESRVSRFSVGRKPRYSGESELPCPNVEGTASRTVSHLALTQGPIMLNAVNDDKASRIGHKFKVITVTKTPATFSEFIRQWATKDMYAWSCRGNPLGREILSLSVCWDFETVHHMDIESPHFHWTDARKVFGKRSIKVTFDAKFQLRYLMHNDVMPVPTFWDPKVAAWLLEPDSDERSLQTLFDATFPLYRASTADRMAEPTCSRAAWQALKLMGSLADRLQRQGLDDHFKGVEMPMAPILAKMEHVGIGFVEQVFSGYDGVFKTALRDLEAEAHTITGHPFSLTEPREVGKVLYDELRLPYDEMLSPMMRREDDRKRALGKAVYRRTCKEVLTKLTDHHPLPAIIMEHRRLSMLITAHLLPLRMASAMSVEFQMARVSCTLQTHTATGRMIAINPNLQNLPHPRSNGDGRAIDSLDLRNSFRAAEGMTFVSADYNQIELRIIAHLAEDENLISLIRSGGDFFNLLASQIFEKRLEAVTKEERQKAKALTYGVMYGQGSLAISEELGVSLAEAEAFVRRLETAFPGIPEWKRRTVESCYDFGYVETMLGRRRYLPAIHSKSALERSHAERQSINTTVQGSAADLIKVAMTHVDKRFREKRWGSWIGDRTDPRLCPLLLLPIHDELIFEVPIGLLDIIRPIIRDCMEKTCEMRVPLNVRLKVGQIWGQMREEED